MASRLESHLIERERMLLSAGVRKSSGAIDQLLASDFLEIGLSGDMHTKRDVLRALPVETRDHEVITKDFFVRTVSQDVVLVTYRSARLQNDVISRSARRSSL